MNGQGHQGDHAADDGVPVQNAGLRADSPVGPERKEEIAIRLEWNAANYVGQGRAEEHRQERTGEKEQTVKKRTPEVVINVHAQLDAGAAQNKQPQHNHQGQVEAAEGCGIKSREGKIEGAAAGQQPDFVSVPDRTNASEHDLPVGFAARQQWDAGCRRQGRNRRARRRRPA